MGSCVSTATTTSDAINLPPMAKIITIAGSHMEYTTPVSASNVLGGDSAASFLFSSDRLYISEYIQALDSEELRQPGEMHFPLPSAKLRYPLSREDLAALAVKASSAQGPWSQRGSRKSKKIRVVPAPKMKGDWHSSSGVDDGQAKRYEEKARSGAPPALVLRKVKRSGSV